MSNIFKEKREALSVSIQDAAKVTRVKSSYLKAIEEDAFEKLPSFEVYSKGYIREYARFLGIAANEAVASYEKYLVDKKGALKKQPSDISSTSKISEYKHQVSVVNESISHIPSTVYERSAAKSETKKTLPFKKFAWVLPVLAIGGLLYLISNVFTGSNTSLEPIPIVKNASQEPPAVNASEQANTQQNIQSSASGADLKLEVQPVAKKKYNLGIAATEITWLQIVLDETEKKEVVLYPGDSISYDADRLISILIGNAGGVKLNFNGKEVSKLGNKGEVIKLNLPEDLSQFQQSQSSSITQQSSPQR